VFSPCLQKQGVLRHRDKISRLPNPDQSQLPPINSNPGAATHNYKLPYAYWRGWRPARAVHNRARVRNRYKPTKNYNLCEILHKNKFKPSVLNNFCLRTPYKRSDSSVCIATGLQSGRSEFDSLTGQGIFILSTVFKTYTLDPPI
jgi:hypothetical protein